MYSISAFVKDVCVFVCDQLGRVCVIAWVYVCVCAYIWKPVGDCHCKLEPCVYILFPNKSFVHVKNGDHSIYLTKTCFWRYLNWKALFKRRKPRSVDDTFISQRIRMSFNYEKWCILIPAMYISKIVLFICYSPDIVENAFPNARIAKLPKSVGTMNKVLFSLSFLFQQSHVLIFYLLCIIFDLIGHIWSVIWQKCFSWS